MIDLNDYQLRNGGRRYYRVRCNECGSDRGYHSRCASDLLCSTCANKKIAASKKGTTVSIDKKIKFSLARGADIEAYSKYETKQVNGRTKFKCNCPECGIEVWKNKVAIGRVCSDCVNILAGRKMKGRISPNKGKNTGKARSIEQKTIRKRMSSSICRALRKRGSGKLGKSTFDILGYSLVDLVKHLESRFEDGMSWNNRDLWDIDHVVPDSWFDYKSINDEGFKKCWSLDNLQPMWTVHNNSKNNRYIGKYRDLQPINNDIINEDHKEDKL